MYRVGDKILCKNNYENFIIKNRYYIIKNIIWTSYLETELECVLMVCENKKLLYVNFKDYDYFLSGYGSIMFREYFYTLKEERKIKLEKLNNVGDKVL